MIIAASRNPRWKKDDLTKSRATLICLFIIERSGDGIRHLTAPEIGANDSW